MFLTTDECPDKTASLVCICSAHTLICVEIGRWSDIILGSVGVLCFIHNLRFVQSPGCLVQVSEEEYCFFGVCELCVAISGSLVQFLNWVLDRDSQPCPVLELGSLSGQPGLVLDWDSQPCPVLEPVKVLDQDSQF